MTTTELGIILGTIWVAPHAPRWVGHITGLILLAITVAHDRGWI